MLSRNLKRTGVKSLQLHTKGKQHIKLIMGDFNAKIGQQEHGETSVGKYGYGDRNERGEQLIEFAEAENLSIMNSFKNHGFSMRVVRVKLAALVGMACLAIWCMHMWLPPWTHVPTLDEVQREEEVIEQACRHPDLDSNNPFIKKYIQDLGVLECKKEIDWIETSKGWIRVNPVAIKRHGKITCDIIYILRVTDYVNTESKVTKFTSDHGSIKLDHDFFTVQCTSANDKLKWKNLMLGIHRNETCVNRAKALKPAEGSMGLNVLIFGVDSMSRLHYMRKLPKTYHYLTKVLNATVLKGYNIVGDGTPQALIPILTGFTELELPETRKRMKNANFVNIYPFVWKNFTANGYVTGYGEDGPSTGTFMYRLKGFSDAPTDHYMRPFYLEVDNKMKDHSKYCLGNTPRHKVILNYLWQFFDVYTDVRKFCFLFHSELSHDDYNLIGYADADTEMFLKNLHDDGILNDTLLIMMSDHGHRFASIRETQQGKQEERMPLFSFVVPPWFEKKYPMHAQNLRKNADRLVTPFDIYPTLLTLLNPDVPKVGDVSSRGISLFSEIPQQRTCTEADVEPHWCACLSWAAVLPTDPIVTEVGQAVIDFINDYTSSQRGVCVPLVLDKVTRIEKMQPNRALLKYKKNADKDGFIGDFSDNTELTEVLYQIQLRSFPNLGVYETSLKYNPSKKVFDINERDISRINMYGNQEHCIHDTYPNMRKFCYCKVQLS